jgi:hypothetical protein
MVAYYARSESVIENRNVTLFTAPPQRQYDATQLEDLRQALSMWDDSTQYYTIGSASDLELSEDGYLPYGYKLTREALLQLCRRISRPLYLTISDIIGLRFSAADVSVPLAIALLNDVVKLRISRLTDSPICMVRNADWRTVDAIIKRRSTRVNNGQALDAVMAALTARHGPLRFCGATADGRYLLAMLAFGEPFELCGQPVWYGYQLNNRRSVAVGMTIHPMLYFPNLGLHAIGKRWFISYAREAHVAQAIDDVVGAAASEFCRDMLSCASEPSMAQRLEWLQMPVTVPQAAQVGGTLFKGRSMPRNVWRRLFMRLASYGPIGSEQVTHTQAERRQWTLFDLAIRAMHDGAAHQIRMHEALEFFAYDALFGKINPEVIYGACSKERSAIRRRQAGRSVKTDSKSGHPVVQPEGAGDI